MARGTVIFLLQQQGFVLNLKKSVLTSTQIIDFLELTVDSLIMKKVSKVQKQCLKFFQKTQVSILELARLISLLYSTIQAVLPAQINFRYLQQQQLQVLKTYGSYCKKVILNSGGYKIWKFAVVVTWFSLTVNYWYRRMNPERHGCSMSRDINRREGWSKEEQLLHNNVLELKAAKFSILTFSKQKSLKAVHF